MEDKYFEYLNQILFPRGPNLHRFLAITANIEKVFVQELSITLLLGLMLGLFKPDGIEFG
jgi:hypothetical protein